MSSASDCTVVVGTVVSGTVSLSVSGVAGVKLDFSNSSMAVCAISMT